ncbi:hypothetical protein BGZ80_002356 [Entomortierella chlamydospora]|uniref:Proteasome assembly chaperone 2 n=1 Tax=Entomortierella chlamydospora TaxID=101097 RepID=A0A9P6MPY4_9FUNG|nr:hypothetical protein BGZ79_001408 [Entomortierella chlamydospora]KAG0009467.1 hypothetical protein BGZ80_002356 [Entomortierella chlamydospora]
MTSQSTDANIIPKFEPTLVIAFPDVLLAGPKILLSANATSTHGQPIAEWSHYFKRQSAKKPSTSSKVASADVKAIIYSATTFTDPQQQQQQNLSLLTIAAAPPTTEQAYNLCKAIVDHARTSNTHKIILLGASNFVSKEQKTHVAQIHHDSLKGFPVLPKDVPLGDHILNTFLTLLTFIDIPTVALIHPAKKGMSLRESQAIIEDLTASLVSVIGDKNSTEFSAERAFNHKVHKIEDEEDLESMMYL